MKSTILIVNFLVFAILDNCYSQVSELNLNYVDAVSRLSLGNEINRLSEGNSIEITSWVLGCDMMHPQERTLEICKLQDSYSVSFCTLSKVMSKDEIATLINPFALSLKNMNPINACTTFKKVSIKLNARYYIGFDGSCKWNEFTKLVHAIFDMYAHEQIDVLCPKDG